MFAEVLYLKASVGSREMRDLLLPFLFYCPVWLKYVQTL